LSDSNERGLFNVLLTLIISVSFGLSTNNLARSDLHSCADSGGGSRKWKNSSVKVGCEIGLSRADLRVICRRYGGFARREGWGWGRVDLHFGTQIMRQDRFSRVRLF
jgi:hypothetical protein